MSAVATLAGRDAGVQATNGWEFAWWALIVFALLAWAVIRRWRALPPDPNQPDDEDEED